MRLVYGIHGYGQGHATRAWAVLPELARTHEVQIFAGGDAYDALSPAFAVKRIPTLGFVYRGSRTSKWRTLTRNVPLLWDILRLGPATREVLADFKEFRPNVVVCDCEPWTFRVAGLLGIPRIAFDHFGIMVRCKVPLAWRDWVQSLVDRSVYQLIVGRAERALVSSFYAAPTRTPKVRMIGPLLRKQVRSVMPSDGSHLLVYFNKGANQLTKPVLAALQGVGIEVRLYGAPQQGRLGNIVFRPRADLAFLEDLASCRAVLSTAGNQLVGEAMQFGKPLLVLPEACVEQRMNAAAVARLSVGEWIAPERLTAEAIRAFLDRAPEYATWSRRLAQDGKAEALGTLEKWIDELAPNKVRRRSSFREAIA